MSLRVVGYDPGFANMGLAAVDLHSPAGSTLLGIKLITTSPGAKKKKLTQAADEERRLALIYDAMIGFLDEWKPEVIVSEVRPFGKSAKAVAGPAMAYAMLFAEARGRGIVMTTIPPQEIKRALTGKKQATKEDVFAEIKRQHPDFSDWPDTKKFEHVADAAGAALASRSLALVYALLGHKPRRRR